MALLSSSSSSSSTLSSSASSSSSLSSSPPVQTEAMMSRLAKSMSLIFVTFSILSLLTFQTALGEQLEKQQHRKVTDSLSSSSSLFSSSSSLTSSSPLPVNREKRQVRSSVVQRRWTPRADRLTNIIQQIENEGEDENLLLYTPTTPSPEDVNCYVEIPVTQHIGGRCINMGSFIGCQAGVYLAYDSTCNQSLGDRERGSTPPNDYRARRRNNPFARSRNSNPFRTRSRP